MPPLVTDAIVLHAFDYLETSRIVRLATRDAGVQSVIAKGARRPKGKFSGALDLFAEGTAEIHVKETRELQTLGAFDVTRSRASLASDLGRFTAAAALTELVLRFARDEENPSLYESLSESLDALASAAPGTSATMGLAGAWRIVAALGFAPALDECSSCHQPVPRGRPAMFSHPAGGVLCDACARRVRGSRALPPEARDAIRAWLEEETPGHSLGTPEVRAHQRLLREFLMEHLSEQRALKAFEAWERELA